MKPGTAIARKTGVILWLALMAAGTCSTSAHARPPAAPAAAAPVRCLDTNAGNDVLLTAARDFQPGVAPRLFLVLGKDRHALLKSVLDAGDDPNICHAGLSPLMVAVASADIEAVKLLLDAGAKPDNPRDSNGSTPLHYALGTAPLEIAALLLDRGADARVLGDGGKTTLHSLALQALPPAPQRALQIVLAARLLQQGVALDAVMTQGSSALLVAAATGNLELTSLLLERGANPLLRNKRGEDALSSARQRGHAAVVERLQRHLAGRTANVPAPAAAVQK